MIGLTHFENMTVQQVMVPVVITATPSQKMESVAKLFGLHHVSAVPVINETGQCIGIFTSHDLVKYQSTLSDANARIDHGMSYDLAHYGSQDDQRIIERPFDEVNRHMTTCLQTIDIDETVGKAAEIMCHQRIHHLLVLDDRSCPLGILSSLDILAKLFDVPIAKSEDITPIDNSCE